MKTTESPEIIVYPPFNFLFVFFFFFGRGGWGGEFKSNKVNRLHCVYTFLTSTYYEHDTFRSIHSFGVFLDMLVTFIVA